MINMMRADLYRIFRGLHFYLAIGLIILLASISVGMREASHIGNVSLEYRDETLVDIGEIDPDGLPYTVRTDEQKKGFIFEILAANVNLYYPLIFIVFAVLIMDFSDHTIKNTLSTTVSKQKYYLSKLTLILLLSTALVLFNSIFTYVLNFIVNGRAYTAPFTKVLSVTCRHLPMFWGIAGFMTMVGFLCKKAAAFNAVVIPFQLLFQILLNLLCLMTEWKLFWNFLENYELRTALIKLTVSTDKNYIAACFGIGLTETIVAAFIGYYFFKKSEIR